MANSKLHQYMPDYAVPPGDTLLELLDSLGMSQRDLATRSGRPVKTINEIIKGKAGITAQTALQFERILGVPASFWNNLERNYRDALARIAEQENLQAQAAWLGKFPFNAMTKAGWLRACKNPIDQLRELLNFFGIASPTQWRELWANEQVAYRKSGVFQSHPIAVTAWLRKGDLEAQRLPCEPYDKNRFRTELKSIRNLTVETEPSVFVPRLESLAATAGVAVVLVRELPGIRISGAARWLSSNKALIQLTLRYSPKDHLWFSFFHEAAHILYDKKGEKFLDEDNTGGKSTSHQEDRADRFAGDFLIPPDKYTKFCKEEDFSRASVERFSTEIGIAPGIVVGRLQHDEVIPYGTRLNSLKVRYRWAG